MAMNPLSIFAGPSPLPPQVGTVNANAASQFATGQSEIATGQSLAAGGQSALATAGKLTAPERATVNQYEKGLENTALQTYENMGLTPSKTTSYISTEADIRQKSIALSQQFIDQNFKEAFAELSAGASFLTMGSQAEDAANKDLLATAQMQITADTAYSKLIGDTIGNIAKIGAAVATGGASIPLTSMPNIPGAGPSWMGGSDPNLGAS